MSRKYFSWLFAATFLVGMAVLILPQQTARDDVDETGLLLPDLAGRVNEIDWLQLSGAGGVVATLRRDGDVWVVEEASKYRADWDRLRELLAGLAQARVVEAKTSNPEYYARLGVEDVSADSAGGVMISFSPASGQPAVIIGNEARGRTGQYARLADSEGSALIDTVLDAPAESSAWLDASIVDIPEAEVVEVRVTQPGGAVVRAVKASADDEHFQLLDIPEGREIKSEWSVNALGSALANLELEGVAAQGDLEWESAGSLYVLTADGLAIQASVLERLGSTEGEDSEFWIRLEAELYTTALSSEAEDPAHVSDARSRAEEINRRVGGWAYRIPRYKYNGMTVRMEDLLNAVPET